MEASLWVPALLILVGMVGIVLPLLPGLLLVVAGVLVWALDTGTPLAWTVLAVSVVLWAAGFGLRYAVPERRLRAAGVRRSTLVLAVLLGLVGFFVVPVVGGALGFVLGVYLVELGHSHSSREARSATRSALGAVFTSMGIDLLAALAIATTWVAGVLLSRA
jgi:uncharacterized protein YqgC (DUF456 family)